ncbi:GNAT family N-acetyltransferase [Leucobacter coleopterorum]|uniref:GNAT family N-acetyltransferase n=1 Tax=Leucobacter coleopterorum TaxID=2714933 RepID=UPI00244E09D7|nr:GNAT family N-acetyltransferase [Leucobacter coleopterorum]
MPHQTERLTLSPISAEEAARIVACSPIPEDNWASDYPLEDEIDPLRGLIKRTKTGYEPHPFTMYRISERATGQAIGGLGFFRPPDEQGHVTVGFGLVESARHKGYATEALQAAVEIARAEGASAILADTTTSNTASQGVLRKSGLEETHREGESIYYRLNLKGTNPLK